MTKKTPPKKQSSATLSKLAGKYLRVSMEEFGQMEPSLVWRDVVRIAASIVSQDETKKPKKAKR